MVLTGVLSREWEGSSSLTVTGEATVQRQDFLEGVQLGIGGSNGWGRSRGLGGGRVVPSTSRFA